MKNIEVYHDIMRLSKEIYDLSDAMTIKLKCKLICDMCNKAVSNERLNGDSEGNSRGD